MKRIIRLTAFLPLAGVFCLLFLASWAQGQPTNPAITWTGSIQSVDAEHKVLVVNGRQVQVVAETVIKNAEGAVAEFSALTVGKQVEVKGTEVANSGVVPSPLRASEIKIRANTAPTPTPTPTQPPVLNTCGPIQALTVSPRSVTIDNKVLQVVLTTAVLDASGRGIEFSALVTGQQACAKYVSTASGLIAVEIRLSQPPLMVFEGEIQEKTADPRTIKVQGVPIIVNDETIITQQTITATSEAMLPEVRLTFDDLKVGDRVRVEAAGSNTIPAGFPIAKNIRVLSTTPPTQDVRVGGKVESIDAEHSSFVAAGYEVMVSGTTNIHNSQHQARTFADIKVGMFVQIVGTRVQTFAPTEHPVLAGKEVILYEQPNNETRIVEGRIFEIRAEQHVLVVNGIPILTNEDTTYVGLANAVDFGFDDLKVGDIVRVEAKAQNWTPATGAIEPANLQLVAVKVTLKEREDDTGHPVHLDGVVQEVHGDAHTILVRGTLVHVTDETTIHRDNSAGEVSFDDLKVGQLVIVEGVINADDSVNAIIVVILQNTNPGGNVHIEGHIERVNAGDHSIGVRGSVVKIVEETEIKDESNNALTFEDLVEGLAVVVDGHRVEGSPAIVADKLVVLDDASCTAVEMEGTITELLPTVALEGAFAFRLDLTPVIGNSETEIVTQDGRHLAPADLKVGDRVRVAGCLNVNDGLHARRVVKFVVNNPCERTVVMFGTVKAIDAANDKMMVNDVEVRVGDAVPVYAANGTQLVGLADLAVGDNVRVNGRLLTLRVLVACEVRVLGTLPDPVRPNHVRGPIVSIDAEAKSLVVHDTTVLTTDTTRIVSRRDQELKFEDLAVGMMVDAAGKRSADNKLLAEVIRVQEENPGNADHAVNVRGFVLATSADSIQVGDTTVAVNAEPIVKQRGGDATLADLHVGSFVRVRALKAEDDSLTAKLIEIRLAAIEAIDADALTFKANGATFLTTGATTYNELAGDSIAFADLLVGDLIDITGTYDGTDVTAAAVVRYARPRPQIDNPLFDEGQNGTDGRGRPIVICDKPGNTYGSIELPFESFTGDPNTLYEIRATVSSNLTDPFRAPVLRLRTNLSSFERATEFVVTGTGEGQFAPTVDGREYRHLFVTPVESDDTALSSREWYPSLDILSFNATDSVNAAFRLDSFEVVPISMDQVKVVRTLETDRFTDGSNGWIFRGQKPLFSEPVASVGENGTLDLSATDTFCFGAWIKETGVAFEPGRLYRARYFVSTAVSDPARVPTVRMRLNVSDYQLASMVVVESESNASESPTSDPRVYDVYLAAPAEVSGAATIQAAFDLLNFRSGNDLNVPVSLEQFQLEEVVVLP